MPSSRSHQRSLCASGSKIPVWTHLVWDCSWGSMTRRQSMTVIKGGNAGQVHPGARRQSQAWGTQGVTLNFPSAAYVSRSHYPFTSRVTSPTHRLITLFLFFLHPFQSPTQPPSPSIASSSNHSLPHSLQSSPSRWHTATLSTTISSKIRISPRPQTYKVE